MNTLEQSNLSRTMAEDAPSELRVKKLLHLRAKSDSVFDSNPSSMPSRQQLSFWSATHHVFASVWGGDVFLNMGLFSIIAHVLADKSGQTWHGIRHVYCESFFCGGLGYILAVVSTDTAEYFPVHLPRAR